MKKMISELLDVLEKEFDKSEFETKCFFSPISVAVMGDPCGEIGGVGLYIPLSRGNYLLLRKNNQGLIRIHNIDNAETIEYRLGGADCKYDSDSKFYNTLIYEMQIRKIDVKGFDIVYYSDADENLKHSEYLSLKMGVAFALNRAFNDSLKINTLIKIVGKALGYKPEDRNSFAELFTIAKSQKDTALFFNSSTLNYVPLKLYNENLNVYVLYKDISLSEKITKAKLELRNCLKILQEEHNIDRLGLLSGEDLPVASAFCKDKMQWQKLQYVVGENDRTIDAVKHLARADYKKVKELFHESYTAFTENTSIDQTSFTSIYDDLYSNDEVMGVKHFYNDKSFGLIVISRKDLGEDIGTLLSDTDITLSSYMIGGGIHEKLEVK
ncbi:MAG: hypothetical protein ACEPOV_06470 [Hyphomicrobiales bacterium]